MSGNHMASPRRSSVAQSSGDVPEGRWFESIRRGDDQLRDALAVAHAAYAGDGSERTALALRHWAEAILEHPAVRQWLHANGAQRIVMNNQRLRSGLIEVIRLNPDSPSSDYAKKVLSEVDA